MARKYNLNEHIAEGDPLHPETHEAIAEAVNDLDDRTADIETDLTTRLSPTELNATFAARVKTGVVTRNADGSIATTVEDGVTHTYGRDVSGAIVTDSTSSRVVTYTRDTAGITGWTTGAPQ